MSSAGLSGSYARFVGSNAGLLLVLFLFATGAKAPAYAQWQIQTAPTTADLRGIHALGNGLAWASGSEGTVLRTTDDGAHWQRCATPPDAEALDFRGIQAFDANTAIVMSSGKGPLSRLYKTTDACQTWTLLFTNPDPDGFWDALYFEDRHFGVLLGDPVLTHFVLFNTRDAGETWDRRNAKGVNVSSEGQGVFAASNSSLIAWTGLAHRFFVSGGSDGSFIYSCNGRLEPDTDHWDADCLKTRLPLGSNSASSGTFSIAVHGSDFIVVGGDYAKPQAHQRNAAWSVGGETWLPAQTPPHGFRSAVAYDAAAKTWITVGPNGTDISTDDGRNWRALKPSASEAPDADQHWNALSLPFVVGPHGRIGRLRPDALAPSAQGAKP